jgi:asparagine synthase (glutamine-hydrolysing)
MCGICGIVNFKKEESIAEETLKRMNQSLIHRGPDDEGAYLENNVGLAIRRLSIIDLETGHQPIHNEDGSVWMVFNGEIYNYKELRAELQNSGHIFYTNTDSEVIVHAYEQYGEECVSKFRGMFSFALWDKRQNALLLARDRFGIKPLYYSIARDKIIFGSEIKSLLQSNSISKDLNFVAIDSFFSFSYIPGPQTIFNKINKLLPSHILVLKEGKINIKKYWTLDFSLKINASEDAYINRLSELLDETIDLHLRSDVPLGIFLSGGIDSSTIAYLASRRYAQPLKTFTIGFDDEEFNELQYARLVARKLNTEHYEGLIDDKAIDSLPKIVSYLSEPLADMSIVPTYFVSELARSKVKVILCGEGGDEMFAGYPWYKVSAAAELYQRLPLGIRKLLASFAKKRDNGFLEDNSKFYRRLRDFLQYSSLPYSGRYLWRIAYFKEHQKSKIFSDDFKDQLSGIGKGNYPFGQEINFRDFLTAMLYYDTMFFLPDDLLMKMDQMTMAHSLEGRVPLLDHKLVEFAASLPSKMKLNNNTSKYILRKIASANMPDELLNRPKQGFMPPMKKWMDKRFDDFFMPILNDSKTKSRGYFNQLFIERMIKQHRSGKIDYSHQIWTIIIFELWLRLHIG